VDDAINAAERAYELWQAGRRMPWLTEDALNELATIDDEAYRAYCRSYGLDPDAPQDEEWE